MYCKRMHEYEINKRCSAVHSVSLLAEGSRYSSDEKQDAGNSHSLSPTTSSIISTSNEKEMSNFLLLIHVAIASRRGVTGKAILVDCR